MTESKNAERAVYVPKVGEKVRVTKRRYPGPPGIGEELVVVRARAVANECWCAIQFLGYDEAEWHCVVEPSETPDQERPECDVRDRLFHGDCCSFCGATNGNLVYSADSSAPYKVCNYPKHGYEVWWGACVEEYKRRAALAEKKAHGDSALCSACGLNPVAVGCHCEHCHRRRVERTEAPASKPDPYAEHRRHLDRDMALANDAAVAVATDRQNELRHHGWAKKQRQALEQLMRPIEKRPTVKVGYEEGTRGRCGRTVPNEAPPSWPEDASSDAEWLP